MCNNCEKITHFGKLFAVFFSMNSIHPSFSLSQLHGVTLYDILIWINTSVKRYQDWLSCLCSPSHKKWNSRRRHWLYSPHSKWGDLCHESKMTYAVVLFFPCLGQRTVILIFSISYVIWICWRIRIGIESVFQTRHHPGNNLARMV